MPKFSLVFPLIFCYWGEGKQGWVGRGGVSSLLLLKLYLLPLSVISTSLILRHGNLKEEEKRGFMRAIAVQDYNPSIRIFVEALTVGMKNRLIKVNTKWR